MRKLKNIYPENSIVLAPLSGFTDLPYRRSARRHGCFYAFTEMVDAGSLVYRNPKTLKMLERGDDEQWLGFQLVGADVQVLAEAVRIVNDRNFDVIDFNLGCPAPKVARKGEGAVLAENQDKALAAFEAIVSNSKIPVSAKIRILDDRNPEPTVELAGRLYEAGACAVTVHGRIRRKFYAGEVFFDIIKEVRKALPCTTLANGGVFDAETFSVMRRKTGCNSVMIARGAMGNPWIFDELNAVLKNKEWTPPTPDEFADEVFEHILEMTHFYGLKLGLTVARKVILDYMRGRGFSRKLKTRVIEIASIDDLRLFTDALRKGPSCRYRYWLEKNRNATRRLTIID